MNGSHMIISHKLNKHVCCLATDKNCENKKEKLF
jgi:hypothetical protein